ncbi:MAG TPA: hypothetical protein PKY87_02235 [Terricaulis sp.]|nr:hypothetical protein [Terricaulis sp.]
MARAKAATKELKKPPAKEEPIGEENIVAAALTKAGYEQDDDGIWRLGDSAFIVRPADEEPETTAPALSFAKLPNLDAKHLAGQIGDFLLDQVKHARHMKPWNQLKEYEQRQLINAAGDLGREIVTAAVQSIAGKGFESIDATLETFTGKGGSELSFKLNAPLSAANMVKLANKGQIVQLVFADAATFMGAMNAKPEPDQPDMIGEPEDEAEAEDDAGDDDEEIDAETGEILTPAEAPAEQPTA